MNQFLNGYYDSVAKECLRLHKTAAVLTPHGARKKKEKEMGNYSLPIGLGLTGAGYGLMRAGNTMISPRDEALMRQATGYVDEIQNALPVDRPELYVDRMVPASQSKVWGRYGVIDISKAIRVGAQKILGTNFGAPVPKRDGVMGMVDMLRAHPWDEHSGDHYKIFGLGRVPAYRHELPAGTGWRSPADGGITPDPKTDYTNQQDAEKAFDEVRDRTAKEMGVKPIGTSPESGDYYSPSDDTKVYVNLKDNIKKWDPRLESTINKLKENLGEGLGAGAAGYAGIANAAIGVRNKLQIAGAAAGVTGLGLLGWWAWRKAHHKKNQMEGKKAPGPTTINLPIGASIKLASLAAYVAVPG